MYQLVFLQFDEDQSLSLYLRFDAVFDKMKDIYKLMNIKVTVHESNLFLSQETFAFVIETLKSRIVQDCSIDELQNKVQKIVDFYYITNHKVDNKVAKFGKVSGKLYIIYNYLYNKSIISSAIDVCQYYSDFCIIEQIEKSSHLDYYMKFFHNKTWESKQHIYNKLYAFNVLFD